MYYHFFSGREDKIAVLNHIFDQTGLRVFDHHSGAGQEPSEYKNVAEIIAKFDLRHTQQHFQLWSPSFGSGYDFTKISVDPRRNNGHSFAYMFAGISISLYFGKEHEYQKQKMLRSTQILHVTEKKSAGEDAPPGRIDWQSLISTGRKLKSHVHNKLAVRTRGAFGILNEADQLEKTGYQLIP